MNSAKNTAAMDLHMLNRILYRFGKSSEFITVYNFVLLRDYCLVFEEIVETFDLPVQLDKNINRIRQNVKLFGRRKSLKNDDIYLKIRKIHEENFKSYENNIGLFLKEDQIIGSTIYNTYIFLDSEFEDPFSSLSDSGSKEKIKNFLVETISETIVEIESHILGSIDLNLYQADSSIKNETIRIKNFDVRAEKFFEDDRKALAYQSLQFRLLICLQELNYLIFIHDAFINNKNVQFIDEYTFTRLLTKGLDPILKNVNNLWKYSNKEFMMWTATMDKKLKNDIQSLAKNIDLINWVKRYRDMIHYDIHTQNSNSNFLDVLNTNKDFINECHQVYEEAVLPLQKGISDYIIATKPHQYSLFKMISMKLRGSRNAK
ncbi:hypothetical protein ATL39_2797 [Sinobaca qinghaiensis]|uniref:Uncharacterized protein n=1 Tax=Sinobaca qinghaiensis TaxID=342944 RepID=A0A419V0L1_9BACL|nr:hypothetical protein [Sinobaca qinghaiensis]RKD71400.1 hypothetical protein ATL39_2797 [Sinobaca qinghaiensis]